MKVVVAYEHDPANLATIYLGVGTRTDPPVEWVPALRDTVDGRRVVWARLEVTSPSTVWVHDSEERRRVAAVRP